MSSNKLFDKVLIANRGEIALRVIKTLKKLNIRSVAVYSEADINSLHVQEADEAYYIGGSSATESYLSIENIISAIRSSGAQAIHPGCGFLSENAQFISALKREGVTFIGPSVYSVKKMGNKIEAKKIASDAKVNTVPGYIGTINNLEQANNIAETLGWPVIVKAALGGGGRGMRVIHNQSEMQAAYRSAKLEAENTFNDHRVFIEKFISNPRHIEVQILGDQYGNILCLGERECSIQRHHQKIIEETPATVLNEEIRSKIYQQAISLAVKVGYYSAGTVEFIIDTNGNFYFIEMNTRLQIEHPITEMVFDIDIVEQMIRIAAGEKLSFVQDELKQKGHAIECRIYSEDPTRNFLPSTGRITEYNEPLKGPNLRIDTSVKSGSEVSMFYDPMIAKISVHEDNREEAISKMKAALSSFIIQGVAHNITFLESIINHPRFIKGDINTNFIDEEYSKGFCDISLTKEAINIFLGTVVYIFIAEQKRAFSSLSNDQTDISTRWIISIDEELFPVIIKPTIDGYNIRQLDTRIYVRSRWDIGQKLFKGTINGKYVSVRIKHIKTGYELTHSGISVRVFVRSPRVSELESIMIPKKANDSQNVIKSPLSGYISFINVKVGDDVIIGQDLVVLTAMKMDNVIFAEQKGKIKSIAVQEGQQVNTGDLLFEIQDNEIKNN